MIAALKRWLRQRSSARRWRKELDYWSPLIANLMANQKCTVRHMRKQGRPWGHAEVDCYVTHFVRACRRSKEVRKLIRETSSFHVDRKQPSMVMCGLCQLAEALLRLAVTDPLPATQAADYSLLMCNCVFRMLTEEPSLHPSWKVQVHVRVDRIEDIDARKCDCALDTVAARNYYKWGIAGWPQ